MEQEMVEAGLFEPAYTYFVIKIFITVFLWFLAIKIIISGTSSYSWVLLAAFFHAVGNQQMAFVLHDSSHN
jgi:hypothetical protein